MKQEKPIKRILEGIVVSDKMNKTIAVTVTKKLFHALYKKLIVKRKKYKAHDEDNKAKIGDKVKIIESRPYSKDKRFRLLEIIK
ncbi:MAG: 30S ribosomal protein S17 [Candidatus Omnitrophica bacterium]|nr:30S ribosomal protein S17 [Candidatus Omnitrophota bacterium]